MCEGERGKDERRGLKEESRRWESVKKTKEAGRWRETGRPDQGGDRQGRDASTKLRG